MQAEQAGFKALTPRETDGIAAIPLEEAEREPWTVRRGPQAGRVGPMGQLYEEGAIDLVDLAWIICNWSEPRKKRAAFTLLSYNVGQPQTVQAVLRFGPEVVGGSDYLEEQQYDSMMTALLYGFLGVFCGIMMLLGLLWTFVQRVLEGHSWLTLAIAGLFWLAVSVVPLGLYTRRKWNQEISNFRNYRKGREGEEGLVERVRATLDNRWTAFRNLKLPNQKGDCDLVLVGPRGVYALEVKSWGSKLRVRDGVWEEQGPSGWKPSRTNPQAQAVGAAVGIHEWLKKNGIVLYVDKAIVLTQPQSVTAFGTSKAPVWLHFQIDDKLQELNGLPVALADDVRSGIVSILKEAASLTNKKRA